MRWDWNKRQRCWDLPPCCQEFWVYGLWLAQCWHECLLPSPPTDPSCIHDDLLLLADWIRRGDLKPWSSSLCHPYCRGTYQISSQCPAQTQTELHICPTRSLALVANGQPSWSGFGVCWNLWGTMRTHSSEQLLTSSPKDILLHNGHSTKLG